MRIGLIVDHPKRDLEGVVLTAYALARRGAEAVIIPMYYQGVDIPCLGLDAVVMNYTRTANKALIARYAQAGIKVFVLDTEGGVLAETGGNSPPALARRLREEGYGGLLAGYLFWGSRLKDAFAAEGVLSPERLHVTGCPRFDFAGPPWRAYLDAERRGYVLVNANFPLVNPRFSGSAGHERESMVAAGWDGAYVDRLLADTKGVFARYLETVRSVIAARPNLSFLVRPHPFERKEPYLEAVRGLSNVIVDGTGSVLSVIHNSRAILHLNCGTAVEAVMLGKLPVQMEFLNTTATAGHARLPARVSHTAGSLDALLAVLDDLDGATVRFAFDALYKEHIHPFFHDNDGRAGDRVADTLMCEITKHAKVRRWHSLGASLMGSRANPGLGQVANGVVSVMLGSAATAALRALMSPARADKIFTVEQVEAILARIAAQDGKGGSFAVRRHHGGLLQLPLASLQVRAA